MRQDQAAIEAEAAEAERETQEFEARRQAELEAVLAAMDKRTRYNVLHRPERCCAQAARRAGPAVPPKQSARDRQEIEAIYRDAAALTELHGIEHNVDHLVPLVGVCPATGAAIVCGLHVPSNLRAIPRSHNQMRGNRYYGGFAPMVDDDIPF
ncbi:hypothetical protein [Tabrizicola sp.]|uniref:hypothetical protein n=1 Tax=Tabrizicola sp. TaxID=2005166 RepID=UPI001A5C9E8D|nr:hypothetical protein [Tabrizicola sp.]MBL9072513.1 hypothetical protein [Tabrizicola sp.]